MTNQTAPDFILPNLKDGKVKLSDILKKKQVVLVFYRGGWCPLCNKQLAELSQHYPKFKDLNIEILAVSNEETKKGKKLLKKISPPFPILYDTNSKIIAKYNLVVKKRDPLGWILRKHKYAHPAVIFIGTDRKIQWVYKGKTYKDRPSPETILQAVRKYSK